MKKMMKSFAALMLIAVCLVIILAGCSQNRKKTMQEQQLTELTNSTQPEKPKVYNIIGRGVVIRNGAGENFEKLINEKATAMLGTTEYCKIDYSCTVVVEETQGDWSKIRVVSPDHLSASHRGWIPSSAIEREKQDYTEQLDKESYEILTTQHNNQVQNFHVLIKTEFDEQSLLVFARRFKNEHCKGQCNIMIYDDKSVIGSATKYPVPDSEYLNLADHFVGLMDFSGDYLQFYPFQDFHYAELGGKNWEKEPIKAE